MSIKVENEVELTKTTCPYCGVGCGIVVSKDQNEYKVRGNPDHPSNLGRICSKGAALADTLDDEGRMLQPQINGMEVPWDDALELIAQRFQYSIDKFGRDSVAMYVSGQLLTEDYYVANKLMKGFIGNANIDTNSRLCMSSVVAAQKRAYGSDSVPCSYEDLERTNLIVIVGSNTAWCHPVIFQRIRQAKKDNPGLQVVIIDPRKTASCDIADIHLAINSGKDPVLFNGLLSYLNDQGEINKLFTDNCVDGLESTLESAYESSGDIDEVAKICGLSKEQIEDFYALFARKEKVVTLFSQGINQSSSGTDKINAIINCHLLSGRIGRPGMGAFSLTGQPNAMGGREVGGLCNQLTAHMDLENASHRELVQQHWQSPFIADKAGYKAVDLFDAILDDKIKALWVIGTNPAVSMPDNNRVREALSHCEFLVVQDCMQSTDTTDLGHVLLPASTWGERDGMVTNSERRLSRQRSFRDAPGEALPDWKVISLVAGKMGFESEFNYESPLEIFKEFAALSGKENNGTRDFDISLYSDLDEKGYEQFIPTQWPVTFNQLNGTKRLFENGRFFTDSGKARMIPVIPQGPANPVTEQYPLILNSGRIRDQWHTMTRTGKSPKLSTHISEAYIQIHPEDAGKYNIVAENLVNVSSRWGEVTVRACISDEVPEGMVFMPMHWNDQYASNAVTGKLVNPDRDPYSGQPEFKHTPVSIKAAKKSWYGFLLSRRQLDLSTQDYWNLNKGHHLWRYEIAGNDTPDNWAENARNLLCAHEENVSWMEYFDPSAKRYRAARIVGESLESCIFISPDQHLPNRDWLMALFDKQSLNDKEKAFLLSGRPGEAGDDAGASVCACFGVGRNTILKAIKEDKLDSIDAIGKALQAGTNCGSCIPELTALLNEKS
ncbi:MAG: nitrate reductase [endosymbiont of Galathealinum brachiosum]|uniref:nitrate reductase (cytochrome) n=1 Tax=endosymbiont of Galathealinum brachiosum TaxID=2200906 RepID=A0A370DG81_9GAMM|nr:MAG: nitrate reductase [endosymbiont of Galathealinum brachiosum]